MYEATDVFGDKTTVQVTTGNEDHVELVVRESAKETEAEALFRPEQAADLGAAIVQAATDAGAPEPVNGCLSTSGANAAEITFNEGLIRFAAIHKREISFRYAKGNGAVLETRTVIPSKVRTVGEHLTFTGHDVDRDNMLRAYRLDRIRGDAWL